MFPDLLFFYSARTGKTGSWNGSGMGREVPKFILLPVSSMQASMGSQLLSSSYVPFA
jgi:hypothetical protein